MSWAPGAALVIGRLEHAVHQAHHVVDVAGAPEGVGLAPAPGAELQVAALGNVERRHGGAADLAGQRQHHAGLAPGTAEIDGVAVLEVEVGVRAVVAEDCAQGDLPLLVGAAHVAVEVHLHALGERGAALGAAKFQHEHLLGHWSGSFTEAIASCRRSMRTNTQSSSAAWPRTTSSAWAAQLGAPHAAQSLAGSSASIRSSSLLRSTASRRLRPSGRTGRALRCSSRSKKCSRSIARTFSSGTAAP